jgi:hypothetical protein
MDWDGWYTAIDNFSKLFGASPGIPQFLFFDENDQPNDNGPNACLKGCYNE